MKTQTPKMKILQSCALFVAAGLAFTAAPRALANTELWIGVPDTSVTTNWSDNANWSNVTGGGNPGPAGNDVIFGDGGAAAVGTVNSVVDNNSLNTLSLTFTNNTGAGNSHTVLIPDGIGLTNANALTVGIRLSTANSYATTVEFVGGGTLVQNGAVQVDNSTTVGGSGLLPLLDLSGLTNFIYTNVTGSITIAGTSSGSEARGSGQLNLAADTNIITVGTLNVALGTGNGGLGGTINLGTGTNVVNVGTVNLAAGKVNNATIKFLGPTGGLRLRGVTGDDSDRNVTMTLGNRSNSGTGTPTGVLNFLGGYPVDVKVNSVTLGRSNQAGAGTGTISFDTGVIDATTIAMAISSSTGGATGNINVSGGLLIVNSISMVNQTGATTATGNLTINNQGVVICSNNIVKTTTAGVANITMDNGSLIIATNVGTSTARIDNFTISDSGLTVPAALSAPIQASTLTPGGTTNTINVSSVPQLFSYPTQFPLISYVTAAGDNTTFVAGNIAGVFTGYISNNVDNSSIDLVITNGPAIAAAKAITWTGTPTGDWTNSPSVLNWVTNGLAVNFNQGDSVTFNDSLTGTTNVNLTMVLTPGADGVTVNNSAANYLFSGIGSISGNGGLTKLGAGTLILDNSGNNNFIGPVTITAGTVQIGNNDTNGNLPVDVSWDNEGTLAFNRSDNLTISTVISGGGSLVKQGNGKLNLDTTETYTGNTKVLGGTLALTTNGTIASTASVLVQNGTFDLSAIPPFSTVSPVAVNSGTLIVDTNNITTSAFGTTNSTIRINANTSGASIMATSLSSGGTTNYINISGVQNVGSPSLPFVIPIISYNSATFNGGFNFGLTNFPNAYLTNDTTGNAIDLVLTALPYQVTWNGGSLIGNNWSDSNNWSGASIFPGDSLFFDGSARVNPVNDTAAGTTYSNITFNGTASPFTLTGNPVTLVGGVFNDSANTQLVALGITFNSTISLNGTAGPLVMGGGLTNTFSGNGGISVTLTGTGILTNLLNSSANGTNVIAENDSSGNWTLLDNASSTPITAPWILEVTNGTFNFGSASSAPTLISTTVNGAPQDHQLAVAASSTATLNFSNGTFTTSARLNTAIGSGSSGTINQYGGTMNIGSQFQGANGTGGTSAVNLYGGTMNVAGPFYLASRGTSVLTVTNSALLTCTILDVSRSINSSIPGTVNLNGGTIAANSVTNGSANAGATATGSTGTFNFNGGILKARTNSVGFFHGRQSGPTIPLSAIVQAGGAIIDSDVFSIGFLEPLVTDPNLGGAPDGGLTKLGAGTLTLGADNTYVGNTLVGAGTLLVDGIQGPSLVIVSNGATLGGNGFIGSNVTVNAGGSLAPGDNAVGVLTVAGDVSLGGTTTMEIDKNLGTNDMLVSTNVTPSTITYGGTLNVSVVAGSVALNDSFQLFSATNYAGSFSAITPAFPGSGLAWNTNNLNVNGTLSVVVGPSGPTTNATITSVTLSGTNILIHGTNNNVPNTGGHYVVLTSTDVSTPLSNWTPVVTNSFNPDGTFDYASPIVPGTARQFIDIKAVP